MLCECGDNRSPMSITLVLGGARSGKSLFAEDLASRSGWPVTYIATARVTGIDATNNDTEMAARIAHHRARRPSAWRTVEAPLALAAALETHAAANTCVLVDCLTLWLSNLLFAEQRKFPETGVIDPGAEFIRQRDALHDVLPDLPGDIILVSNEIGFGVTPMGAVTRFFVDEAGRVNQRVAASADQVRLIVAGCPVAVKG